MTKANQQAGKASHTGAKAADTTKAGAATSPQSTAQAGKGSHQIADGHQLSIKGKTYGAGHRVSAADFANRADPDGKAGLQRLVDGGELVKASGKAAKDDGDERAGGGVIDEGGATGAAPSGAQIVAAETGDDPQAAKVVDAALSGSESELTAAADPDGKAGTGKGE